MLYETSTFFHSIHTFSPFHHKLHAVQQKAETERKLKNLHLINFDILNVEEFTPNLEGSVFFHWIFYQMVFYNIW